MRILIVTQYFWPENFPVNYFAVGLKDKGHDVTVITGIPNYPGGSFYPGYGFFKKTKEVYNGIKIVRVPLLSRGSGSPLRLLMNYVSFAFFASVLGPFRLSGKFDIIFAYEPSPITVGLPAILIKKLKRAPLMFWVQDLWPESLSATGAVKSKTILKAVEKSVKFIYRNCDRILVQSKTFIPHIKALGPEEGKIMYLPNSADSFYRPVTLAPDAPEQSVMPKGFRITFAGNIGAAQDFPNILDAAEKLKGYEDIHWVIFGNGRMRPWVEAQVKERGLNSTVHLMGKHPTESMPRYFALSDVLLVTLKKEDIFSLTIPAKVQSYLACAKPVIAALDGEGARIIEEAQAGIAVAASNPEALAGAVLQMYQKPETERREMGQLGRAYFDANFEGNMLLARLEGWMKDFFEEANSH